jgi:hypothetical protein
MNLIEPGKARRRSLPMPQKLMRTRIELLGVALAAIAIMLASPLAPTAGAAAKRHRCTGHRATHHRGGAPKRCRRRSTAPRQTRPTAVGVEPAAAPPLRQQPVLATPPLESTSAPSASRPKPPSPRSEPFRFYSPTSFWNTAIPAGAPLDPESGPIVSAFNALIESEQLARSGPSINTIEYSTPIYTVPANQPTVKVTLDAQHAPALQAAWEAVPMPPNARPAVGTDGRLVVWQPGTDKLWDFWRARHEADGWHAAWGGATQNVSTASGLPDAASWPGAQPWWGTSGCSLGIVGGLITIEDLEMGVINHAVQIGIPNVRAREYASPALRTDGHTEDPLALPEGARLRLDPELDLATLAMPRVTRVIAQAAQRYGIIVTNGGGDVAFQAEDPTPTGTEPYRGVSGFWEGSYPRELLSRFPWSRLQLLKMELHG